MKHQETDGPLRYRQLEHTADVKVEIYGRDMAELFANAAFCVSDVMYEPESVEERMSRKVTLSAADASELFMDWLRELLFLFSNQGLAFCRVQVDQVEPERLAATVFGDEYDMNRHGLKVELKTPTYHNFRLERLPEGFRATVVFDA
jgi:SHS2 domain-containing protein